MSRPVILSGVVCVTMLALGFNLLLPLRSGLETVCVLIAVYGLFRPFGWRIAEPSKRRLKEPRGDRDARSHPIDYRNCSFWRKANGKFEHCFIK